MITIGQSSYVGFGPNTNMDCEYCIPVIHDRTIPVNMTSYFILPVGYIGCMRSVSIQSVVLDPVQIVHSALSAGVTLGLCNLTDWCQVLEQPFCHNGGQCVSLWTERHCDCSETDFVGKYCQFSENLDIKSIIKYSSWEVNLNGFLPGKLKQSCSDLYQSGVTHSGVFRLDLDGSGPLLPAYTYCDMGVEERNRAYGVTRVQHNLEPGTVIRDPSFDDMKKVLSYRYGSFTSGKNHISCINKHSEWW